MTRDSAENFACAPFPKSVLLVNRQEFKAVELTIDGTLPEDLCGHAFVIGPAGFVDSRPLPNTNTIHPASDGTPLFNGDAMIYRLDFDRADAQQVRLTSNIVKTPCFYTDRASIPGTAYEEFGYKNYGLARLSLALGFRNQVNTAFLPMRFSEEEGERLLVTWDAGRPYEIDTETLEVATPIGWNVEWRDQIELPMPFGIAMTAAHAFFDPYTADAGKMFTVNYGKSLWTALAPIIKADTDEQRRAVLDQCLDGLEGGLKSAIAILQPLLEIEQRMLSFKIPSQLKSFLKSFLNESWQKLKQIVVPKETPVSPISNHPILTIESSLPSGIELPDTLLVFWQEWVNLLEQTLEQSLDDFYQLCEDSIKLLRTVRSLSSATMAMEDFIRLIRWDGKGKFQTWEVVLEEAGKRTPIQIRQTIHQIAVTKEYVILADTVFKLGPEQLLTNPLPQHPQLSRLLRNLLSYRQDANTHLYIIRRADLDPNCSTVIAKKIVIPRAAAHFLADYDSPDSKITLHLAHNTAWDPSAWTRPFDNFLHQNASTSYGMSTAGMDANHLGRYIVDGETGELIESAVLTHFHLTWMTAIFAYNGIFAPRQFKNIYWNSWGCWQELLSQHIVDAYRDVQYRTVPVEKVLEITRQGLPVNLCRLDTEKMEIADNYQFSPGYFGNSAQFVPRNSSRRQLTLSEKRPQADPPEASDPKDESTDGYLLCVVNSSDRYSEIWVFDAANLRQGPLCKLSHPQLNMGMTIHTTWLPKIGKRSADYNIPVKEDYQARLKTQPEKIKQLFEQAVYPHFPEHHKKNIVKHHQ